LQLACRYPLFDTAIINLYHPGDGITPHVDLLRFADGIAIVSLGDAAIMNFTPDGCEVEGEMQQQCCDVEHTKQQEQQYSGACQQPLHQQHQQHDCCQQKQQPLHSQQQHPLQQQLLLQGGDVLLLHGAARYRWRHGIAAVTEEVLLCGSCKAAAAAAAVAAAAAAHQPAVAELAAGSCSQPSMRQQAQDADCGAQLEQTVSAVEGENGVLVHHPARHACKLCLRVVRGRRVSLTLRRLDPAHNTLDMQ
jgi:hypothetical protein